MVKSIALFLFFLIPTATYAQLDSQFIFNGQNAEVLKSEKVVSVLKQESVRVPDICSRQVPNGERRVCHDVTRYNEQCTWIPSSTRCSDETDRVCRPVTRTRQECSSGPSQSVCTDRPTREVCTERPVREICRTGPDGRQHCNTVGGGTQCTTVGGGQTCREAPGERVCRDVTYRDEVCENVLNRRCETVPGRNDCQREPYTEEVCEMETNYREVNYACTRTEIVNSYSKVNLKAKTNVQIVTNGLVEEFPVQLSIIPASEEYLKFTMEVKLLKQPKVIVVLKKNELRLVSSEKNELEIEGTVILEVLTQEMLPISFPLSVSSAVIEKEANKLTLLFDGGLAAQGTVDILLTHKAFLGRTATILELKADYPSSAIEVGQIQEKAALKINLKDVEIGELKKKNMKMKLTLSSTMNLQGEIMNESKPTTTKLYEGIFVELK